MAPAPSAPHCYLGTESSTVKDLPPPFAPHLPPTLLSLAAHLHVTLRSVAALLQGGGCHGAAQGTPSSPSCTGCIGHKVGPSWHPRAEQPKLRAATVSQKAEAGGAGPGRVEQAHGEAGTLHKERQSSSFLAACEPSVVVRAGGSCSVPVSCSKSTSSTLKSIFTRSSACTRSCRAELTSDPATPCFHKG